MSQNGAQPDKSKAQPPKKSKKQKEEDDLSEEDVQLKEKLALLVERLQDSNPEIAKTALSGLIDEVKSATTTVTSVPKSLKFLKIHYPTIKNTYNTLSESDLSKSFADFLSVLSMTFGDASQQESLHFLMKGTLADFTNWGHEYLLHLSGDISREYNKRIEAQKPTQDLLSIVEKIVPFLIQHHSEAYAIDLLIEVDKLEDLTSYVNEHNYQRVVLYLLSSSQFSADQEEMNKTLTIAYDSCIKQKKYNDALRIAIRLDDLNLIKRTFDECKDRLVQKQMALNLARQRINIELDEELTRITSNTHLNEFYIELAKDLDVLEPKTPEQIYKSHLEERKGAAQIDSAKQNLASTIVNAFVNAGTGRDALMLNKDKKDEEWIHKVRADGAISATASLGMIFLWDIAGGNEIMDYLDIQDSYAKMGACIGIGLSNTGITSEVDTAKALLEEQMGTKNDLSTLGAIIGLGLAYAGTAREDFLETLTPIVCEVNHSLEMSALAALSLGLIFVGTRHEDVTTMIIETLTERPENQLNMTMARFFGVALGLLFLGKQEACEATVEALGVISHPIKQYIELCVESCAYVGSGNVLKVQKMLHACSDKLEEKDSAHQAVAVLGIGLIAASEEIGNDMALRSMNHLLQYGDLPLRRAVPLGLAALNISNPKIQIQDLLSKLAYDSDVELSHRAIIGLGLIGAGTNNARIAGILRQLASYYGKENNTLYLVRIAQGFLHMGKGLLTLQPYYSDKFLMSKVGFAGIITFLHASLDTTNILCDKYHYLFYYLGLSTYPRMLFTVNEDLKPALISVRVGQAVDMVGQAGQPKRITGFQTHTSPVILASGERAELGTEEYLPVEESVLENIIIVRKNPDYQEPKEARKKI